MPVKIKWPMISLILTSLLVLLFVPGSAFRARDRFVSGSPSALIAHSNGIHRRVADVFYILFEPGSFDYFNALKGAFKNGDLQIGVQQLEPERGDCSL